MSATQQKVMRLVKERGNVTHKQLVFDPSGRHTDGTDFGIKRQELLNNNDNC